MITIITSSVPVLLFGRSYCCTEYDQLLEWDCRLSVRLSVCIDWQSLIFELTSHFQDDVILHRQMLQPGY